MPMVARALSARGRLGAPGRKGARAGSEFEFEVRMEGWRPTHETASKRNARQRDAQHLRHDLYLLAWSHSGTESLAPDYVSAPGVEGIARDRERRPAFQNLIMQPPFV